MPLRSEWRLQREGFTFDTILTVLNKTALNPLATLPLYLAGLYTQRGQDYISSHPTLYKWLKVSLYLGLWNRINNFLSKGAANNWVNDVYDWKKEIVVVTGGSDGIGANIVKLLAEKGIKIAILDIQEPKYTTPPNAHYFPCDLASPSAIKKTAEDIKTHLGDPTILINNAGFARGKSILTTTQSDLSLTFDINAKSHYYLAQAFLPSMIEKNHGMIVTVASLAAYVTAPRLVDYSASKAAALAFHEGLAAELATLYNAPKVRTVLMCQGYTTTSLFAGFHKGDGFMSYPLDPETVAEEIVKAVLRGQSTSIVLPRNSVTVRGARNWPIWMQIGLRKDLKKVMKEWRGRQVVQPSEETVAESGNGSGSNGLGESRTYEKVERVDSSTAEK